MTERRDPRSFVASVLVQYGYSHETAETLVQRALDAHAHELAERIRNDREPWEWALAGAHAGSDAADLIDPEVTP
ncbi:hypothetical protein [Streptomyces scopuliridis]|uniref:hypothetical protein n=1 Tax=Streptomyces scopuliridis TaxID=452529 RepID=UPI0036AA614E